MKFAEMPKAMPNRLSRKKGPCFPTFTETHQLDTKSESAFVSLLCSVVQESRSTSTSFVRRQSMLANLDVSLISASDSRESDDCMLQQKGILINGVQL